MRPGEFRARGILVGVCLAALAVILGAGGCVQEEIGACGYSCERSGGRMASYSRSAGCRCEYSSAPDGGGR
jgi:hypothetical protein